MVKIQKTFTEFRGAQKMVTSGSRCCCPNHSSQKKPHLEESWSSTGAAWESWEEKHLDSFLSPPGPLTTHLSFCHLRSFVLSAMSYVVGIIWYVTFSDDFFQLVVCIWSFLHVSSWLGSSFLFVPELHSIAWMHRISCIFSPVEGHLGCFHVWVITNKAAVNIKIFF